ncbi:SAGA histone acetylase and TREX-2 complexes component [Malassezia pachydermatis]|uniref:Transcription factor e 2 n=1 Tax=Malassezia pachydermatis TaxID=77020 RepID=A0A0M9VRJ8_9BASI|nr:transcription factor e 2 [Malassezia pachydermatis]KOS16555.1 transcription factor e 2 [Malassezia pachydermatis]
MSDQDNGESCEQLLNLLHQRLIATGEWSSLLMQLRQMLEDSGWEAKLRDHAEQEARSQESLHLATMVDKLGTYAHDTFPESIRASIGAKLRDFLDRNLEDA